MVHLAHPTVLSPTTIPGSVVAETPFLYSRGNYMEDKTKKSKNPKLPSGQLVSRVPTVLTAKTSGLLSTDTAIGAQITPGEKQYWRSCFIPDDPDRKIGEIC